MTYTHSRLFRAKCGHCSFTGIACLPSSPVEFDLLKVQHLIIRVVRHKVGLQGKRLGRPPWLCRPNNIPQPQAASRFHHEATWNENNRRYSLLFQILCLDDWLPEYPCVPAHKWSDFPNWRNFFIWRPRAALNDLMFFLISFKMKNLGSTPPRVGPVYSSAASVDSNYLATQEFQHPFRRVLPVPRSRLESWDWFFLLVYVISSIGSDTSRVLVYDGCAWPSYALFAVFGIK